MRVERVIYFVEAARSGSMRAAAEHLGVAQSVMSGQITALEEELNIVLLNRGRHGVSITDAGRRIFEDALGLIAAQRTLVETALGLTDDLSGVVNIGANPALAASIVTPVIAELRKIHMGIQPVLLEAASPELLEHVERGSLDFALLTGPASLSQGLAPQSTLASTVMSAYVMPGHALYTRDRITWDELGEFPLVAMRPDTTVGAGLIRHLPKAKIVAQVSSIRHVIFMVESDMGIGVAAPQPRSFGSPLGRWVPIHPHERINIDLVQSGSKPVTRSVRLVRDAVQARAKQFDVVDS